MIKIVFAHLYNDRSGSPRVLASVIDAVSPAGNGVLYIGSDGQGTLDTVDVAIVKYRFKRRGQRLLNALAFFASQIDLFFQLLGRQDIAKNAVIYVNTIMPFGAALYGWATGRKVIYHLHEVSITPRILLWFLSACAKLSGDKFLYVSQFHMDALPTDPARSSVIFNSVDSRLYQRSLTEPKRVVNDATFKILMLASPRDYKGIPELIELASRLIDRRDVTIDLVVNSSQEEISAYFARYSVPHNVNICPATATPEDHYVNADLVLNLSRVDQWIETFGLTLIEAMAFGIPVIAPPVGGPSEIVRDGLDGFLIDSRDGIKLHDVVVSLLHDSDLMKRLSESARQRAKMFTPEKFEHTIKQILKPYDFSK